MVLERIGWRFVRIRGSRFYRDRDAAMQPVYERLRETGIRPMERRSAPAHIQREDDLVERVRTRAAVIREEILELRKSGFCPAGSVVALGRRNFASYRRGCARTFLRRQALRQANRASGCRP